MSYSHHSYSQSSSSKSQSPPSTTPQKQYPTAHATSSAFSASANVNEDWTKISDLAERRRIQNRIAQRNYRKKLKKRLEDLEKRAGSSSASPEQSPQQLVDHEPEELPRAASSTSRASRRRPDRSPQPHSSQPAYVLSSGTDDRGMFAQQYTRQLSTSPPPFSSYATLPTTTMDGGYQPYQLQHHPQQQHLTAAAYCHTGAGLDMPLYPQYMASMNYAHQALPPPAIKQEYYGDDESSPFSIGYASMAAGGSGSSGTAASSYHDVPAYTPPLTSDSFDHGSPPELCWPGTPPLYGHA